MSGIWDRPTLAWLTNIQAHLFVHVAKLRDPLPHMDVHISEGAKPETRRLGRTSGKMERVLYKEVAHMGVHISEGAKSSQAGCSPVRLRAAHRKERVLRKGRTQTHPFPQL
eukprot:613693-Pelagomonas_calceolata.AAC.1